MYDEAVDNYIVVLEQSTPCGGDAFQSTMIGATWQTKLCYWCKEGAGNGGKCVGDWPPEILMDECQEEI